MQVCEGMRPSTPQAEEIASAKILRWESAYFVEGRGCLVLEKMARRLDGHSEGFGVILRWKTVKARKSEKTWGVQKKVRSVFYELRICLGEMRWK